MELQRLFGFVPVTTMVLVLLVQQQALLLQLLAHQAFLLHPQMAPYL
jgi:hypothetical protein